PDVRFGTAMKNKTRITRATLAGILLLATIGGFVALRGVAGADKEERPFGIAERKPWTTSRITGSPEPPHPYRLERFFPKLTFKNPVLMVLAPGGDRFFVVEQAGKMFSFRNDPNVAKADLFADLPAQLHSWDKAGKVEGVGDTYALVFHPQF